MALSAADKLEIMEIAARACYATDEFMPEQWAALFTDDAVVTVGDDLRLEGKEALLEHVRSKRAGNVRNRHLTSNPVIDGDGDSASMRVCVTVYDLAEGLGAPCTLGEYLYDLIKVDDTWKVKRRNTLLLAGRSRVTRPRETER